MLRDLSRWQANGHSVGGRYHKHDTVRLWFIKDIALRGLRHLKRQKVFYILTELTESISTCRHIPPPSPPSERTAR